MAKKQFYDYNGRLAVIRFEAKRCIHAEECVHGLPGVFERHRRPWIDPDQAPPQDLADVVARCPSGALQMERLDGGPAVVPPEENTARLVSDGPVYLEGRLGLLLPDGSQREETRLALCRCGDSQNKPFCDNSHLEVGFTDEGALGTATPTPTDEDREDPIELRPAANGPVLFQGPLEMFSADGKDSQQLCKGALCRCGASQNKPYCDGSHTRAGFEAD